MRKTCTRTGKTFNTKSNRQKYCKTVLCGECPLRAPKTKPNRLALDYEQKNKDYNNLECFCDEAGFNYNPSKPYGSNALQDDTYWGTGNSKDDKEYFTRKKDYDIRHNPDKVLCMSDENFKREYTTDLNSNNFRIQKRTVYNALCGKPLVFKIEYFTNRNQYCKRQLKDVKYFIGFEVDRFKFRSIEIPYHLAISIISNANS